MAALSDNIQIQRKDGEILAHPVVETDIIYEGALVKVNAAGYLAPCAAEVGAQFAGIAVEKADNSAGANGAVKCRVYKRGLFLLTGASFAQADVGLPVYATDDQTVTKTNAADKQLVGIIEEYVSSTKAWVRIDAAVAHPLVGAHAADVVTTAATNSSPYGFATQAQADALVARVNTILSVLRLEKSISEA